jgi:DNA-binding NarL/FixJ family response regulator
VLHARDLQNQKLAEPAPVGRIRSALDPFALSTMFQLPPAEARVASHMAAGLTAEEISQNNCTAVSTVRSQISQVISKLGARRTTDVVRMLRQGEALWSIAGQAVDVA